RNLIQGHDPELKFHILKGRIAQLAPEPYLFIIVVVHHYFLDHDTVQGLVKDYLIFTVAILVQYPFIALKINIGRFKTYNRLFVLVEGVVKIKVITILKLAPALKLRSKEQGIL